MLAHMMGPQPKHGTGCCYSGVPRAISARRAVCTPKFLEHRDNHRSDRTSFQSIYTGSNHQKFRIQDQAYEYTTIQTTRHQIRSSKQKLTQITRIQVTSTRAPGIGRHQNSRVSEYQMSKQNYSLTEIDNSQTDTSPL
jgi:hypothetical protein